MEDHTTWKIYCHKDYDYKLVNSGAESLFNVRVTSPMDGVIPYGNDFEAELRIGRAVRFRLINAKRFDPSLVKVFWDDSEGKTHTALLHDLTHKAVAPH